METTAHLELPELLGALVIMLAAAKLFGFLAQRLGQPAVLGELIGGVVIGPSALGWIDPGADVIHLLSELGVVVLLFVIGLETDIVQLVKVGAASTVVAIVGVALPFAMGYAVCRALGLDNLVAIVAGAALTATSVGITARVFSDLGRLKDPESQVVLGAAVIDDVIGLVILAVVSGMVAAPKPTAEVVAPDPAPAAVAAAEPGAPVVAEGGGVSVGEVVWLTTKAFGFLAITLLLGNLAVPPLFRATARLDLPGTPGVLALILAFGLGWLSSFVGLAPIIGAFAAGLLVNRTPQVHEIEKGTIGVGYFLVPLFFIVVGAQVDLAAINPIDPANRRTIAVGALLIVAAVLGKFLSGYSAFWFKGRKDVIGVGMIPRGEVGLIFAKAGLTSGVLDAGMFGAVTLMVIVTTFMAPPILKLQLTARPGPPPPGESLDTVGDLVNEEP